MNRYFFFLFLHIAYIGIIALPLWFIFRDTVITENKGLDLAVFIIFGMSVSYLILFFNKQIDAFIVKHFPNFFKTSYTEMREIAKENMMMRDNLRKKVLSLMLGSYVKKCPVVVIKEVISIMVNERRFRIEKWDVFQAWYKFIYEHEKEYPGVSEYLSKINRGYLRSEDPFYNPNAGSWIEVAENYVYIPDGDELNPSLHFPSVDFYDDDEDDYDDDDDDDYDDDYRDRNKKTDWGKIIKEGLSMGVGYSIGENLFNNK